MVFAGVHTSTYTPAQYTGFSKKEASSLSPKLSHLQLLKSHLSGEVCSDYSNRSYLSLTASGNVSAYSVVSLKEGPVSSTTSASANILSLTVSEKIMAYMNLTQVSYIFLHAKTKHKSFSLCCL